MYLVKITVTCGEHTADLAAQIAADFQQATGTGNTVHVSAYFMGVTDEAWNGAVSQDDLDLTMGV